MRSACFALLCAAGASPALATPWSTAQFGLCYELTRSERGVVLGGQYPTLTQLRDDAAAKSEPGPLTYRVVTAINGKRVTNAQSLLEVAEFAAFHDDPDAPFAVKFADAPEAVPVPPCLEAVSESGRRYTFDTWTPLLVTMAIERAVRQAPLTKDLNATTVDGEVRVATSGEAEGRVYSLFTNDRPGLVLAIDINRDDEEAVVRFAKRTRMRFALSTDAALSPAKARVLFFPEWEPVTMRRALRSFVAMSAQIYDGLRIETSSAAMRASIRNAALDPASEPAPQVPHGTIRGEQASDADAVTPRELAFMSWESVLPPRTNKGYRQAILCSLANDVAKLNAREVGDPRAQRRFTLGGRKSWIIAHNYGESFFFGKEKIDGDFGAMQGAELKALAANPNYLRDRMMECRRSGLVFEE
jgi:hypothetical protein